MNGCPYCGGELRATDSGEPDYVLGWWCEECIMFFTDEELAEYDGEYEGPDDEDELP